MRKPFEGVPSRRGVMQAGLAVLAAGGLTGGTALAAAPERAGPQKLAQDAPKLAQKVVQYQDTPKNGVQCDSCVSWVPPNACKLVEGTISPKGWCVAYAPKEG